MEVDEPTRGKKPFEWVPSQIKPTVAVDLRMQSFEASVLQEELAPKGWKKKTKKKNEEEGMAPVADLTGDVEPADLTNLRATTSREATGVGKTSQRPWKVPAAARSSQGMRNPKLKTAWDKKMEERVSKKAFQEHKNLKKSEIKTKMDEERRRREAAKERKKAAQERSQGTQKITNAATLKRMMKDKKQRKKLKTAA